MGKLRELYPFAKEALHQTARIANFFCILHVTNNYLFTFAKLVGPSMLPTFNDGNIVLTERLTTRSGKVGRGDAVLVRNPEKPRRVVAKRIKGMEGDVVSYLVNPKNSDELKTVVVPKGHVWIEGDNIYNTYDSRNFGPVPYALIHSRVCFVLWPFKDARLLGRDGPSVL